MVIFNSFVQLPEGIYLDEMFSGWYTKGSVKILSTIRIPANGLRTSYDSSDKKKEDPKAETCSRAIPMQTLSTFDNRFIASSYRISNRITLHNNT